ncbi:MAG: branched-chain amino acid aminotransferase [Oscillospiraceae bacterium]|nr:branched-chain amino acid aminotransferase [Oscillospiraceae bacterium]
MKIDIQKNIQPKAKPTDHGALGFGKILTDHMLLIDYTREQGWHDARIVPYGPLSLDPATCCLHYGQLIFEGLKAYKTTDGKTVMFRPDQNVKRLNASAKRMCIPAIDEGDLLGAIARLVKVEEGWIPDSPGTSLYIRPFILGTEQFLGVHPSETYTLCVILSPSGPYYKEGLAPVRIYVEDSYVRAVAGGTGTVKCAGNYAASLASQKESQAKGYSQVLWLDGIERRYIEEVGAMNIFFVIDGQVVTPALTGTILPGVTRKSVLEMLSSWGVPTSERKITIQEIADAHKSGVLDEVFGTGTAAVISPVGELRWGDLSMEIGGGKIGALSQKLYDNLTGIQTGKLADPFGWVYEVVG